MPIKIHELAAKEFDEEIDRCISVLENLAKDTEQLVNLPKEQRIALLKVAGELFSFPIEKETY